MWKPLAAILVLISLPARAEPPVVVASIAPLHSLIAGVMQGVGEPELLVSGPQSEHTYALKPSDARLLERAGMVVYADDGLETFLAKPLKTLAGEAEVIEMSALPGMTLLPRRDDGHDHGHGNAGGHDPHLWLDVGNAAVFVKAVSERLARLDPANAAAYEDNARKLLATLDGLDVSLREDKLKAFRGIPYVTFHDAYQYFERRYGLTSAGVIVSDPEHPPSARRLAQLRDRLKKSSVRCVFAEPQFAQDVAKRLADSAGARLAVLDPLDSPVPGRPEHRYTMMMTFLGRTVAQCLSGK